MKPKKKIMSLNTEIVIWSIIAVVLIYVIFTLLMLKWKQKLGILIVLYWVKDALNKEGG